VNDKFTMIRSMSYTPNGLFNHTAAIYQMMTGYTTDKVSPSGQLEPPSPKDFPNFGSNLIRLKPTTEPMLPFVMFPRPLQESNVVGKGGTAGFLGKAFDPYTLYPAGDDMDMNKMDRIKIDDLQLRPEVFADRLRRRARLRAQINAGMPNIDKAVAEHKLDQYYEQALNLIVSGRAREAFALDREPDAIRDRYGRNTFGHVGHRRRGHQTRLHPRQERQNRLRPAGQAGPPPRAFGYRVPRLRHRPGNDRLQSPEPAAGTGQGTSGDVAVCVVAP